MVRHAIHQRAIVQIFHCHLLKYFLKQETEGKNEKKSKMLVSSSKMLVSGSKILVDKQNVSQYVANC